MKAPASGKEIKKKWVEHILKKDAAAAVTTPPEMLRVDTCTVHKDLGDGYNSQVVFFTVETTEKKESSSPEEKKVYHLVGKFHSQDIQVREMGKKVKANVKEYIMYTEFISELNNMLTAKAPEEPKIHLPRLVYGECSNNKFVLIMENLKYAGYEMNDKYKGLNSSQLKAAVDRIARVHALSYVFIQSADTNKYSWFPSVLQYLQIFKVMMGVMLENCIKFLKSSKETEEIGNKIEICKLELLEKLTNSLGEDFPIKCLSHGDYWNNNFMFKYGDTSDGEETIEDVKIIDWGNSSWGSPLFDLQYLVYTSTSRTIRKNHLDEVLNYYHLTFMRLTTALGSPPNDWSLEQFKNEWDRTYTAGFLFGSTLVQGTLTTTNPVAKKLEPSVLDKQLLFPVKFIMDGMKAGVAKILIPLTLLSGGERFMIGFLSRFMKPILEELKSGKNEVMNTRLLDLIYEADERGLFAT